ncbi:MAG: phenylalanyl-tRNA synthetase alpha chain [Actinomycetota bacterium]|nr:phenylalanyl-tRNA synthetase alpha chain [Actinomycetota bacterium]
MLTPEQLARDLAVRDLTDPTEGAHALQLLLDAAVDVLVDAWGCEVRVARGPRVVPLTDNYDALRFPAADVTRDARYTRYVDDTRMLRSHSSAMVPPALRELAEGDPVHDVLLVCPGITYRRDAVDRLHTGTPHQLDLWRISRRPLTALDLEEMTSLLAGALVPGSAHRAEGRVHPYTLDGRQVDVLADGEWVEVWECGLAHPDVLGAAGVRDRTGLALGMGLDRLLMLRKGIPDIRLLRAAEPRIATQLLDLAPYQPVSTLPPVLRDLSIAVDVADDAELLGDRAREALGAEADCLESIEVVSETGWLQLPDAAVRRLGMDASQKNVLARIVLRPFDRTLTDAEANALRDRVYAGLHRGRVMTWAS